MSKSNVKDFNIDAVILWVNGNDETYKAKLLPFLETQPVSSLQFTNRYDQLDEIEFTVNSIIKYASFIDNIFIVTDNQTPRFLKSDSPKYAKVKIVDHTDIFKGYESCLPTFNSRTIESCIHRIPNLSEHFLYLNDDFFIINPTTRSDFFNDQGYPVLRGYWQSFDEQKILKKEKALKAGHKKAQEAAAKLIGFKKLFRSKHTPHPIRKSTLTNYFKENPKILEENIKYKFRHKDQFLPIPLAYHLELKNKTCVKKKDLQLLYFRSYKKSLILNKLKLISKSRNNLFLSLQNLNRSPKNVQEYLMNWLKNRLK